MLPTYKLKGLILKAVAKPLPSDDRLLSAENVSNVNATCNIPGPPPTEVRKAERGYINAIDRTALFLLHKLSVDVRSKEIGAME